MQEPGNQIALQMDSNLLVQLLENIEFIDAKFLKESLMTDSNVLYLPAHSIFFNLFNEKFKQMFEAGLFNFYIREITVGFVEKSLKVFKEPFQVLTLEELEAGFVVSLIPLLFAIAVFCVEWMIVLKDLMIMKNIFQVFYEMKN